jgi:hypothetical protein
LESGSVRERASWLSRSWSLTVGAHLPPTVPALPRAGDTFRHDVPHRVPQVFPVHRRWGDTRDTRDTSAADGRPHPAPTSLVVPREVGALVDLGVFGWVHLRPGRQVGIIALSCAATCHRLGLSLAVFQVLTELRRNRRGPWLLGRGRASNYSNCHESDTDTN